MSIKALEAWNSIIPRLRQTKENIETQRQNLIKIMLDDSAAPEGEVIKSKKNLYEVDLEVMDKINMFRGNDLWRHEYIPEDLIHNSKLAKSKN